ncbi:MAG: hypothetical protein DMG32_08005 [Acidobacteria bacterium]|nr:MAG: hypothetical protein DMG32_08005 [Acidobacteriota bacterium]
MLTAQAAVIAVVIRTFLTASVHLLEPSSQCIAHVPLALEIGIKQIQFATKPRWGSFLVPSLDCM